MASKRWDLCVSHKDKKDKWRSTKVGVVFEGEKGQLNIKVDPGVALSSPEGVNITAWPPKERDDRGGGRGESPGGGGGYGPPSTGGDDEIPFDRLRGEV